METLRNVENKVNNRLISFRTMLMTKRPGDGHYVALAIGLLLALAIGGILWALLGGQGGLIRTWFNSISTKVTNFINQITT